MAFEPVPQHAKRHSIRFTPSSPTLATILPFTSGKLRSEGLKAIVRDESFRGCCVIVQPSVDVKIGLQGVITVGELAPLQFRIVWIKPVKRGYRKLGIEYLE